MKQITGIELLQFIRSLPIWERGLKQHFLDVLSHQHSVAPYMGAWIETPLRITKQKVLTSLPIWERGLKPVMLAVACCPGSVAPYMGAWIETPLHSLQNLRGPGRSLYGSVD